MKKPIVAGGAALSLAAVFAASSIGDQGSSRPGSFDRNYERVPVHRVDAPSASGSAIAGASKKKKGKPKVRYFETEPQAVPTPRRDIATQCPAKHKALSGYFLSPGGVVLDTSAISETSQRIWGYGLLNLTGADSSAIIGVVCGKKL